MNHDEMIAVIKAHKNGEVIEVRAFGCESWHVVFPFKGFDFVTYEYRIKPRPQEVWINKYPKNGGGFTYAGQHHKTREVAIRQGGAAATPTLFREVIE